MAAPKNQFKTLNARQYRCPECHAWIACQRGRLKLDHHVETEHPEAWARQQEVRKEFE